MNVIRQRFGVTRFSTRRCTHSRGGLSLVEVIVSTVLLGTVTLTLAPLFGWIAQQRRDAEHRQLAMFEVANLTERIAANEWSKITDERLEGLKVSDAVQHSLKGPQLVAGLSRIAGPPEAKRIVLQLSWLDRAGNRVSPVTVVSWRHKQEGGE